MQNRADVRNEHTLHLHLLLNAVQRQLNGSRCGEPKPGESILGGMPPGEIIDEVRSYLIASDRKTQIAAHHLDMLRKRIEESSSQSEVPVEIQAEFESVLNAFAAATNQLGEESVRRGPNSTAFKPLRSDPYGGTDQTASQWPKLPGHLFVGDAFRIHALVGREIREACRASDADACGVPRVTIEDEALHTGSEALRRQGSNRFARVTLPDVLDDHPVPDVQLSFADPMPAAVPYERAVGRNTPYSKRSPASKDRRASASSTPRSPRSSARTTGIKRPMWLMDLTASRSNAARSDGS